MYNRQLEKLCRTRLDDVLLDEGLAERSQVADAQAESEVTGRQLSQVLFDREVLDEWDLAKLVCRHYSLPYVNVDEYSIPESVAGLLPASFCREHGILPIEEFGSYAAVAVCEMPSLAILKQMQDLLHGSPFVYVGLRSAILKIVEELDEEAYLARKRAISIAAGTDGLPGGMPTGRLDLPPITMTLGYSMHARAAQHALPIQSLRAAAPVSEPVASVAPPAAAPAAAPVPDSVEAAPSAPAGAAKAPAAWQEIFDLGDDG
jgi:hypothetical protein